jgi:hypothetical protein
MLTAVLKAVKILLSCCPKNSQDAAVLTALKAVQDAEKNHPHKNQVQRLIPITGVVYSLSAPRYRLSSGRCRHAAASCHASFPLSQDELTVSASSSGNALSRCLPSRGETEELNLHHRRRLPSPDRPTSTLHCYKKIISTLATLPTTQLCLYFISSLARAPSHRSSPHHCRSFSPMSHAHRHSAQRHLR